MTKPSLPTSRIAPRSRRPRQSLHILVATVILSALLLATGNTFPYFSAATNSGAVFSLVVRVSFQDETAEHEFIRIFTPLAKHVRNHEPDTLGFEFLRSDKEPLKGLLLARYIDKDNAFLKVHKSSKEFLEFRPKLQAMQDTKRVVLEGSSFVDSMVGFGDRSSRSLRP